MVEITGVVVGSLFVIFFLYKFAQTIIEYLLGLIFNRVSLLIFIIGFVLYILAPEQVVPYYTTFFKWLFDSLSGLLSTAYEFIKDLYRDLV